MRVVVVSVCVQRLCRKVVEDVRLSVLEVSLMYGIVAVVTGPELTLVCVLELVLLSLFRLKKSNLLGKLLSAF